MVGIAARHGPCRANCLAQSLVLHGLLAMAGIPAELKFGTPYPDPDLARFTAHAWVEYSGINLSDAGTGQRYAVFSR